MDLLMSAADCSHGSDIVFALDSSGSIGSGVVEEVVGFLERVVNDLNVDGNDSEDVTVSRVGLVTFADTASVQFNLNTYRKRTDILAAINVQYSGGKTNEADAIRYSS